MQTHLHGRDMITTQEWTKDELNTVIDVATDDRWNELRTIEK